jgi:hypothetical protein
MGLRDSLVEIQISSKQLVVRHNSLYVERGSPYTTLAIRYNDDA